MRRSRSRYAVKFGLAGVPQTFCHQIAKTDTVRLRRVFENPEPPAPASFVVWDCPRGATVAVSLNDLQFAHILEEPFDLTPTDPDRIEVRLRGRPPILTGAQNPNEVYEVLMELEVFPPEFAGFWDEDRERLWVRSDQLVYVCVPRWIMREARRTLNDEERSNREHEERAQAVERLLSEVRDLPAK